MRSKNYGKWILTGEHTVLRGGGAVVFPSSEFYLEVIFKEEPPPLLNIKAPWPKKYHFVFERALLKALKLIGKNPKGAAFELQGNIPLAKGLGSSAVFCLGLAQVFHSLGWLGESEILNLARTLEDEFHHKSSGADIQAVYHQKPILFKSFNEVEVLTPAWRPHFRLTDSGLFCDTKTCVKKVYDLHQTQKTLALSIDEMMKKSVLLCLEALSSKEGLPLLIEGMNLAQGCFKKWGLCGEPELLVLNQLKEKGALACKPTGSGGGGFILSLWESKPPFTLD